MKNITQKISLIITLMCLMSMSLKAQCVAGLSHNAQQYNGIVYFYDNSTATLGDTIHTYNWNFGDGVTSTQGIVGMVDRSKYDGVIFINIKDSWIDDVDYQDASTIYVTFKPNQIKSVDNDGTWDINDNNIYS